MIPHVRNENRTLHANGGEGIVPGGVCHANDDHINNEMPVSQISAAIEIEEEANLQTTPIHDEIPMTNLQGL